MKVCQVLADCTLHNQIMQKNSVFAWQRRCPGGRSVSGRFGPATAIAVGTCKRVKKLRKASHILSPLHEIQPKSKQQQDCCN